MRYRSTRGGDVDRSFDDVLLAGLASDGGLFVPESIPRLPEESVGWGYRDAMVQVLEMFGADEPAEVVDEAVALFPDDPAPLVDVGDRKVYELFWGPTLSFKDHALQLVGRLLDHTLSKVGRRGMVLGATSGDTGSAAIQACRGRASLDVVVLFPEGRITEFQRRQMTTVPDRNVRAVAIRGDFDDCQRLVKAAFETGAADDLVAINSINWARVACQIGYYVSLGGRIHEPFDVVVPTGNFGNVYSAWVAQVMGAPIHSIKIANNANHQLSDRINGISAEHDDVVPTLAPSMDIAVPSNLERFDGDLASEFTAGWASDRVIVETIQRVHSDHGYLLDPHTASAWSVGESFTTDLTQVVVATAHPAKFSDAIEKAIGTDPGVPAGWEIDPDVPERLTTINPEIEELVGILESR